MPKVLKKLTQSPDNPWVALSVLCIGFFMIMLDTTIVNVAIPTMQHQLPASLNQITWVNSVYLLAFAVPLLLTGRLGDQLGRKPMFLAGMLIFTGPITIPGLIALGVLLLVRPAPSSTPPPSPANDPVSREKFHEKQEKQPA